MNLSQLLRVVAEPPCRAVSAPTAGYLVLQVLRTLREPPATAPLDDIVVTAEGRVAVRAVAPCTPAQLESYIRGLLGRLLEGASAVPPALQRVSGPAASAGLQCLEAELLSALIPINGAASRRALARLRRSHCLPPGGAASLDSLVVSVARAPDHGPLSLLALTGQGAASAEPAAQPVERSVVVPAPGVGRGGPGESSVCFSRGSALQSGEPPDTLSPPSEGPLSARRPASDSTPASRPASELAGRFLAREQSVDCIAQRLRSLVGVGTNPLEPKAD